MRRDIGPSPFFDARAKATTTIRIGVYQVIGIVLPVAVALGDVGVDRPEGAFGALSERVSFGLGAKPYMPAAARGWFELVGGGFEHVSFAPPAGAVPVSSRLGGVERLDLRVLHADRMLIELPDYFVLEAVTDVGMVWLRDPTSATRAKLSTVAGSVGGFVRRIGTEYHSDLAFGLGFVRDAVFMADGSALTRRTHLEGSFEGSAPKRWVGGSVRVAAEQLPDVGTADPFRAALALEAFVVPVQPLELGVHASSTQVCVSAVTAAGPAWCHRFGFFLRAHREWSKQSVLVD
jgi:hypothetical protein